jgi:hypothetical protein
MQQDYARKANGLLQNRDFTHNRVNECRGSVPDAQVGFRVSAANEMQNERHCGQSKKNMNQPTCDVKNNPAANPSNH